MIGAEQAIAKGYAAFKRGEHAAARQTLRGVKHPQAIHLLGLVEKAAGNYADSKTHLAEAARLDPDNHEIFNNQGLLARLMGELHEARLLFTQALALKPDFRSARLSLGRTLSGLGRYQEAMTVLAPLADQRSNDLNARIAFANAALDANDSDAARVQISAILKQDPQHVGGRYAEGVLAFNLGQFDLAERILSELLREGQMPAEVSYMMMRIKLVDGDVSGARTYAEASFQHAKAGKNFDALADIYWMSGDTPAFEKLLRDSLNIPELTLNALALLRKAGREEEALASIDTLVDPVRRSAPIQSLRSAILLDIGDVDAAVAAGRAADRGEDYIEENFNLVRALLAAGEAREALALIEIVRARDPLSQFWLGYEATALRLLDDQRYGGLIDYDHHVRAFELPVPEGFVDLEAFNAAFVNVLDRLNPFDVHPLNQSLRGGGQAPQDLRLIDNPVLHAYFKALDEPIRSYMATLGNSPDHPTAARNTGRYKFDGSWSVRLGSGGHHVNHVHPRGWISSAYYVSVPDETASGKGKAGWLKFGEPPIRTAPELLPEKWVQPKAGMVVLFPSFLWHGTAPIHDGSVRVTAPFDVVPA